MKEKFLNGRLCINVRKAILNNNRPDTWVANVSKLQNRSTYPIQSDNKVLSDYVDPEDN